MTPKILSRTVALTRVTEALVRSCGEQKAGYDVAILKRFAAVAVGTLHGYGVEPAPPPPVVALPMAELPKGLALKDIDLLQLIAEGLSDQEIANRLGVLRVHARTRIRRLYALLEAGGRAQVVAQGYELGFLGPAARRARSRAERAAAASGASEGSRGASRVSAAPQGPSGAAR